MFLLAGDAMAASEICNAGFEVHRIPVNMSFSKQSEDLDAGYYQNANVLILDVAHNLAIKDKKGIALYLEKLHEKVHTIVIDSFGVQSLRKNISELHCTFLVSPYVGEMKSKRSVNYMELLGVDYFVMDVSYQNFRIKNIHKVATRVLVTCGGSDPHYISLKILNALILDAKRKLDIKVIVASGFSSELCDKLVKLSGATPHNINLIKNQNNLSDEMSWCDIAIAMSGLTKYELAATGTPAVLISLDLSHDTVNKNFVREKTAIDLGVAENLSDANLTKAVWALLDDKNERERQSLSGQVLINGQGANNLVDEIFKLASKLH